MWTSTMEVRSKKSVHRKILGLVWRGAYFSSLAPLQVQNLPRQPLTNGNGNWVRVHNRLAGICGSDLHLVFVDGDLSIAPAALPAHEHSYPGHEVVGEVVEIGEQVQNLHVGDRVVLQSAPNCLSAGVQPPCNACATGNYNLCENGNLPGPGQIVGGGKRCCSTSSSCSVSQARWKMGKPCCWNLQPSRFTQCCAGLRSRAKRC